ncbi:hypothetical protein HYV31_01585 [candidate division WWE3 bacterium]|nr:hypothetical protein [candidate division WWE3 bacterium]
MSFIDVQNSIDLLFGNKVVFYSLVFIDLILRGFALWKSARLNEKNWFVAILIVNSLGLLPLGYLIWKRNIKPEGQN